MVWAYLFLGIITQPSQPSQPVEEQAAPAKDEQARPAKLDKLSKQIAEAAQPANVHFIDAHVLVYSSPGCKGESMKVPITNDETKCERCWDACMKKYSDGSKTHQNTKSLMVVAKSSLPDGWSISLSSNCAGEFDYADPGFQPERVTELGECVSGDFNYFLWNGLPDNVVSSKGLAGKGNTYHIVYSAESSYYFGYQALSNLWAFKHSNQAPGTGYTRLMTCSEPDDLTFIPSFNAPRDLYSHQYKPINKPDVVEKWMASPQAPTEDVVVVIDPDNWLLNSVQKWVYRVEPGHGIGHPAFFHGNALVEKLWKEHLCEVNCDFPVVSVGVPYLVHREDLRKIAPLWKSITKRFRAWFAEDSSRQQEYNSLQPEWSAEMYGWVYACAQLGIRITTKDLQMRDVDGRRPEEQAEKIAMVHIGRIWFPNNFTEGKKWEHTEGRNFAMYGRQVWCKCNYTAGDIIPWPSSGQMPPGMDFQSRKTLQILHSALQEYGPLPDSKFRRKAVNHDQYAWTYD